MVQKDKSKKSGPVQDRFDAARAQIDVTQFTSYREFLKNLYDRIKTGRKSYSYIRFATDLGLSASNALWLVLTMRRDLSEASAQKIATSLEMPHESRKYFMLLVRHNNARDPGQREACMKELVVLKSQHFMDNGNDENTLEFFQEWYHPVLREMVALDDFKADPDWINERLFLRLLPKQIERSLALLQELKLIRYDETRQRYVSTGEQIFPSRTVGPLAAVRFHQKACENARESVTAVPSHRRDLNVMTLSISDEAAQKLKDIFHKACEEAMAMESQPQARTEVYQINVQLFALTRKAPGTKNDT
jgi:uncharacterized protein (TIGR02147 family)